MNRACPFLVVRLSSRECVIFLPNPLIGNLMRQTAFWVCTLWLASFASAFAQPVASETRLLRFPAVHENTLVFTYGGNLYTVPSAGGTARQLTSHDGFEMFARFSPDGKHLAFTGQYDGNTEVFLMPAEGGSPKRLTYTATLGRDDVSDRMGPNNIVMGWTPDGKNILFRSRMNSFNDFIGALYTVSIEGGLPEQLPLPRGGFASYSPDGSKLVYNRIFREFRTWKRYRGGMADEVWIYDFKTKTTEAITNDAAGDIIPMWAGDKIYFVSDRDENKRFNIWSYDTKTKATKQVTKFTEFDCKFPSLGNKAIAFENGGDDGARCHEAAQLTVEGACCMHFVEFLRLFKAEAYAFHRADFEALFFDAGENFARVVRTHCVGFDHNQCCFFFKHRVEWVFETPRQSGHGL